MKNTTIFTSLLIFAVVIFTACSKSNGTPGGGGGITFSCAVTSQKFTADVQPIITSLCATSSNCHAIGTTNAGGVLSRYAEVNAKKSNIRSQILSGAMPKNGTISQAQINAIICWIDSGALNN
jgi:hypothetical protein